MEAIHAEGKGAQKRLTQDLGDADAQHSLAGGGTKSSPGLG
jgi:hypothetical protein